MSASPFGLCGGCAHQQLVPTRRSTFTLCLRHKAEPERFRRYPPVPVRACGGFEPRPPGQGPARSGAEA